MNAFFFLFLSGGLIFVAQTTLLAVPVLQVVRYDMFIPFVIYVALYKPVRVGLPLCVLFGFLMDVFSGGIHGLFLSFYFWLFGFVKAGLGILNLQNPLLETALTLVSVLLEGFVIVFLNYLLERTVQRHPWSMEDTGFQIISVCITAPLIFAALLKSGKRQKADEE